MDTSDWISSSIALISLFWGVFVWIKQRKIDKQLLYVHDNPIESLYMMSKGNKEKFIKLLNKNEIEYKVFEEGIVAYYYTYNLISYGNKENLQKNKTNIFINFRR